MLGQDHIVQAARKLWGAENAKLSSQDELRFGTHGSKSVKLRGDQSVWYDHEEQRGGGIVDLCNEAGITDGNGHDQSPWITYDYRDEDGDLLYQVVKKPGHKFLQRRPVSDSSEEWIWDLKDTRRVLYRLPQLLNANPLEPVFIVEGEKDVETLVRMGLVATCNPGGAGKWREDYNEFFLLREVVVLADNDPAGKAHALQIIASLASVAARITHTTMPQGKDVSDWVAMGGTKDELLALVEHVRREIVKDPPPKPALILDDIAFDGVPVPAQKWTVHQRIPANQVCILSGHGSTGKSMIGLHLCVAHAAPRNDWLKSLVTPGPSLFLDAEETIEQIHIRLDPLTQLYDCTYQDLIDGGLAVKTLIDDAIMATVDKNGVVVPTNLYRQVLEYAGDIKTTQIVIANAANVFAGNENDRSQVQQFVGLLKRVALASGGSVVLITHPSLTGLATETGLSGSTQWHNAVRARMWLHGVKSNGADRQEGSDLRILEFMKNQYGPLGENIALQFKDGMFRPMPGISSTDKLARESSVDEVFLTILRRFGDVRRVSPNPGPTYAPKRFEDEDEATAIKADRKELEGAMRRLLSSGRITPKKWGSPAHERTYLTPSN